MDQVYKMPIWSNILNIFYDDGLSIKDVRLFDTNLPLDEFIKELKAAIIKQVGEHAQTNEEYPKLIAHGAYEKIKEEALSYKDRIVFGGEGDDEKDKFSPTLIYPVDINEPIVNHEIFGPLLPIVPFKDEEVDSAHHLEINDPLHLGG